MRVLVVDDDETALLIAAKILAGEGYDVLTAPSGAAALEIIRREGVQAVVSDWNMPEMDGIELCRRLRASTSIGYIYFIIVTSRSGKSDMLSGLSAGADDFISKPFEPAELVVRLRNAERILALETTSVTLFSLAKLAESKDTDTGNHLERIRLYSRLLAERWMQLPEERGQVPPRFQDLMFETSPLHDIGKVGIPDFVLLKPGSLSDDEWRIMKRHAEIGANTLESALARFPSAEFLRMARDIAWAHHEHWDGSGYPRGLRGEDIPLCARVVALADVYDALTMKRVYKAAISHDVARGIIIEDSGHFDPRLVRLFHSVEGQFKQIREQFGD
jgi:putative two-component system response regulator